MWKFAVPGAVIAAITAACSGSGVQPRHGCMSMDAPGAIIAVPGIDLQVRDTYGQGEAIGTTAAIKRSSGEMMAPSIMDTVHIYAAFDISGDFSITLSRPYYQDLTIPKVTVTPNGCVVNTTEVPVTLQLAPGAPPLRALAVAGAAYLGEPHAQVQLVAHFDADPGVSRAVTWVVSDTNLATVDANGLVTARCPRAGGTVKVTATSVATPAVSGDASMSVGPVTSCT